MPKKKYLFYAALLLFIIFVLFSYLVAKKKYTQYDFDTTVKLQDHVPSKFDYPFTLFSFLGAAEVTMTIWLIILVWTGIKRYWLAFQSLFLLPFALIIELFGKYFVNHPNPPLFFYHGALNFKLPSAYIQTGNSYPSGHLTRTAFLITLCSVYLLYKKPLKNQLLVQGALYSFLIVMAVSRVYLGEHWTTDVIGGTMIGASFGIITGLTFPT